jgi:hypothetical protein
MAKAKSFVDKLAKAQSDFTSHCPKCGESIQPIMHVRSEKSKKTNAWKFNKRYVGLCKCNQKELTE